MNKNNNIPTDVKNSLIKLKNLINLIENNLYKPKDSILREIAIELDMSIEGARKLFSLYYPLDGGLCKYILERKRCECINALIKLDDDKLINRRIEEISNCSRAYFDRMLYKDYGVKINDLKKNKENFKINFIKEFDVDELEKSISKIYDYLYNLEDLGYVDIKRTKVKLKTSK